MKSSSGIAIALLALTALLACEDDPTAPPPGDTSGLIALTSRRAVLNNIEYAFNHRDPSAYGALLDPGYTFYFASGDVGGEIPPSWDRTFDLAATTALFESNGTTPIPLAPVCRLIRFDLLLDDLVWTETPILGETGYTATVPYTCLFAMEPNETYQNPAGAQAQFTVREVAVGVGKQWRLVECRDMLDPLATGSRETASVRPATCGAIKALYRGPTPLTSKAAVLNNLEFAWNLRAPDQLDQLLDDDFAFFFAPGDVGGNIPAQWDRANELATSTALFMSNTTPTTGPVCLSVHVRLQTSNVQWLVVIPETAPDETWYTTTILYAFTFEMEPGNSYVAGPASKAQFTVRNAGTGGEQDWRLVEWRDLGSNFLTSGSNQVAVAARTWGAIKAMYL